MGSFALLYVDTGLVMQIKTSCKRSSSTKDEISFTFCQNGQCCSTGGLQGKQKRCRQNNYQGRELRECGQFGFVSTQVQGNTTYR